jgi:hypothetical protein
MSFLDSISAEAQRVMTEYEITELMIYGGPVFIGLIVVEIIFSLKYNPELYKWKDLATSGTMGVGAAALAGVAKAFSLIVFSVVYILFNPEGADGVRHNIMGGWAAFGLGTWYIWLICQVLDDFSYYMVHRANHEVRFSVGSAYRSSFIRPFQSGNRSAQRMGNTFLQTVLLYVDLCPWLPPYYAYDLFEY